jgi:hypothetical protein
VHDRARRGYVDGVVAPVGQVEVAQQNAAVGVRVGAHPPVPRGGELQQFGHRPARLVEQFLRLVGLHPLLQRGKVDRVGAHTGQGHLVGPEGALDLLAVDLDRTRPALGGGQDHHRPAHWSLHLAPRARGPANLADALDHVVKGGGELLVHRGGVVTRDDGRVVAVAAQQGHEVVLGDPGQHRRVGDLEAIEVQHRDDGPAARGVQQLADVPAGGQRAGFGLPVADDAEGDQVGVVQNRAESVEEHVPEFAALVERPGGLRCAVAGHRTPPGKENWRKNRRIPRSSWGMRL